MSVTDTKCVCPCHTGLFFVRSEFIQRLLWCSLPNGFVWLPDKKQNIRFGNMEILIENINLDKISKMIKNEQ